MSMRSRPPERVVGVGDETRLVPALKDVSPGAAPQSCRCCALHARAQQPRADAIRALVQYRAGAPPPGWPIDPLAADELCRVAGAADTRVSGTGSEVTSCGRSGDQLVELRRLATAKFPENVTMAPGDCLVGWLTVEVPIGMKVAKIVYRPGGQTVAEWLP
jgi:hypothetical protein